MPPEIKIALGKADQISQYKLKLEVSKKFGNDGLKVYSLLEKSTDFELLRKSSGLEEDRLYRILGFMARVGLISVEGLPQKYLEESPITEGLIVGVAPTESLMRFRHQKTLFKEFSSDGIKVYEYVRNTESTFDRISRDLGIEPDKVKEILDFMISNGIAYSKQVGPAKAPPAPLPKKAEEAAEKPALPRIGPRAPVSEVKPAPPEIGAKKKEEIAEAPIAKEPLQKVLPPPKGPLVRVDEKAEYRIADLPLAEKYNIQKDMLDKFGAEGLKVYSLFTAPASVGKVAELSGIEIGKVKAIAESLLEKGYLIAEEAKAYPSVKAVKPEETGVALQEKRAAEEKKAPVQKVPHEEEEIKPLEEEEEEEKEEAVPEEREGEEAEVQPPKIEEELAPVEEGIKPEIKEEEEIEPTVEKEEKEEKEEEAPPEVEEEELKTPAAEEEVPPEVEEEIEKLAEEEAEIEERPPEKEELSQFEKIINDAYGEKGLLVYRLIDGKRTAEEIMKEANVDEEFIIEFFGFLENKGIIRLERPREEPAKEEFEGEEKEEPISESTVVQPLTEQIKTPKKEIIILDIVPIDVPIPSKLPLPSRMSLEAKLIAKFGPRALRILNKLDSESDIVKIAIENAIDLDELDEMLYAISNGGGCTFATLSEDDIKRRYGDEALQIYKKYGREGVMIYELIGKMDSLKKMVSFTKVDPKKAVEIIIDINKLLGIEGVTKKDLYAELGLRE